MRESTDIEAKKKTSLIYSLCAKLFSAEFPEYFTAPRTVFRDWLNEKTGLSVDHIKNKHEAFDAWIDKLETMNNDG